MDDTETGRASRSRPTAASLGPTGRRGFATWLPGGEQRIVDLAARTVALGEAEEARG